MNELNPRSSDVGRSVAIDPSLQRKLRADYARTIDAWVATRDEHDEHAEAELFGAFARSGHFLGCFDVRGPGAFSLQEAFFRFVEERGIGDARTREDEFLTAIIKVLSRDPRPEFRVPTCVERASHGFVAVSSRGQPMLYAAVQGRFVTGVITPFLEDLVTSDEAPTVVARRHRMEPAVLKVALERLDSMREDDSVRKNVA